MRRSIVATVAAALLTAILVAPAGARDRTDVRARPFAFHSAVIPTSFYGEPQLVLSKGDHVLICTPGGGDCDIAVGPDNAVYIADLQIFASEIRKSVDDGRTFNTVDTEDPVEQDRQFLAPDPTNPNIVYFGYHDFVAEAVIVAKSIDG